MISAYLILALIVIMLSVTLLVGLGGAYGAVGAYKGGRKAEACGYGILTIAMLACFVRMVTAIIYYW